MSDSHDLRSNLRLTVGETEEEWEITTALATEYEQGVTIIRYAAGTSEETIQAIHKLIEQAAKGLLCE